LNRTNGYCRYHVKFWIKREIKLSADSVGSNAQEAISLEYGMRCIWKAPKTTAPASLLANFGADFEL